MAVARIEHGESGHMSMRQDGWGLGVGGGGGEMLQGNGSRGRNIKHASTLFLLI